jgi:predicted transcriptional regulator
MEEDAMTNEAASIQEDSYTITLSGEALRKLERIAEETQTSIEDCVQRAISLWLFLHEKAAPSDVDVLLRYNNEGRVMRVSVP